MLSLYTKMCAVSLISLHVQKYLYESISRGNPSKYCLQDIGINTYPRVCHACISNIHFLCTNQKNQNHMRPSTGVPYTWAENDDSNECLFFEK